MAQPRLTLVAVLTALATVVAALMASRATAAIDLRAYDLLLSPTRPSDHTSRVAVVAIDDASLAEVGQWPWPRDVVARLVNELRRQGAAAIALDVLFSERDRFGASPGPGETPAGQALSATDAALTDAIAGGRVVTGYAFTFNATSTPMPTPACVPPPLSGTSVAAAGQRDPQERLFTASGIICSLDAFTRSAQAAGFLNVAVDTDGTLRRVPLVIAYHGEVYPSLALSAVQLALGAPSITLAGPADRPLELSLAQSRVGLDDRGTLSLRFREPNREFAHIPAVDVLNGRVAPGALDDRIVFVGATALGVRDSVSTPMHTQQPGIEIHATAAENLLDGNFVVTPAYHRAIEAGVAILLALITAIIAGRWGYQWAGASAIGVLVLCWLGSGWLLRSGNTYLSPVLPTLALGLSLLMVGLMQLRFERGRADDEQHRRRQAHEFVVRSLTSLMEMRDASTGRHSRRTQGYSHLLAQRLAYTPQFRDYLTAERVEFISLLAPLHDIGKVGIRDAVLNKPGQLSPDELQEMRLHPVYGYETISKTQRQVGIDSGHDAAILQLAKDIVYTHHERWDGGGYPRGLRGHDIPVAGRILAVVDVYDALVEPRPYRRRLRHEEAVDLIVAGRGSQFDPVVVDAFLTVAPDFLELGTRLREASPVLN